MKPNQSTIWINYANLPEKKIPLFDIKFTNFKISLDYLI